MKQPNYQEYDMIEGISTVKVNREIIYLVVSALAAIVIYVMLLSLMFDAAEVRSNEAESISKQLIGKD